MEVCERGMEIRNSYQLIESATYAKLYLRAEARASLVLAPRQPPATSEQCVRFGVQWHRAQSRVIHIGLNRWGGIGRLLLAWGAARDPFVPSGSLKVRQG